MLSKNRLKVIKSLRSKKGRTKHRRFIVEGVKPVDEVLSSPLKVETVLYSEGLRPEKAGYGDAFLTDNATLNELSQLSTPPGILAVVEFPDWYDHVTPDVLLATPHLLYLDGIRDPGNLGTIIRTADWFGFKAIILSEDCVDPLNPKVVQAAMGSIFRLPCFTDTLSRIQAQAPKAVYGLDLSGESIYTAELNDGYFVIGSESHGIREETRVQMTSTLNIPGTGGAESLNAAVSAAVLMSEISRRKMS